MLNLDLQEQLPLLYELQQTDTEILAVQNKLKSVPIKIRRLEESFHIYHQTLEEKQRQLADAEKEQRSKAGTLEMQQEQRRKSQARLREVKTNKEYQAVDQEISFLIGKEAEIEDQILETMLLIDQLKEELNQHQKAFDVEQAKNNEQKAEYEKETNVLKAQIADYQERRLDFQPKIHPDLINRYQEWFKRQGTGLISLVVDHACGSCHLRIPPQTLQQARKNEQIIRCGSCQRILYVPPSLPDEASSDEANSEGNISVG